ncbi:hypothetical protein Ptr86124_008699 [Pyrenophora tritici-repentis]|uniref:Uncharacterized protein n=1 Tax=Pyrenophora tritici-repentis TaxID=45151 RepID=A0A922NA57_9PLEO|nr:hypothetical protein Ptr86124_008699 [Pyrenophora tritici-repentis]
MAEALEAEAADVPDAPQEFGPSRVTTQEKVGKSAILSQGRLLVPSGSAAAARPTLPPTLFERLRTWAKLNAASSTQSGGYSR